ncbi:hypothetical protein [uncultured Helicobacter sp.]
MPRGKPITESKTDSKSIKGLDSRFRNSESKIFQNLPLCRILIQGLPKF